MSFRPAARTACCVLMLLAATACLKLAPQPTQIGEHLHFPGDSVQLNSSSDGQQSTVTAYVGEKGPLGFFVDTGSGVNVIDRKIADDLALQKTGEMEVLSGGVEPVTADIVVVPLVRVDNLTIKNAEFITLDLDAMSLGQLQGVLGMSLFREALLTFDPRNERITVSQAELSDTDPDVFSYDNAAEAGLQIEADVAGRRIMMSLDTGAPSGFTFPAALSESLPLQDALRDGPVARLVGGERTTRTGRLAGALRLGELVFDNPQLAFIDPSAPHGNIGSAVLGDLVLSIDQRNSLVALRQSAKPEVTHVDAASQAGKPRRLGVQFRGMPGGSLLEVGMVDAGSLGERAGFKSGDVIVSLNGQTAKELSMRKLGALIKSPTPLRFEVERDGELRIIEIS